jgi:hypothetical protein
MINNWKRLCARVERRSMVIFYVLVGFRSYTIYTKIMTRSSPRSTASTAEKLTKLNRLFRVAYHANELPEIRIVFVSFKVPGSIASIRSNGRNKSA